MKTALTEREEDILFLLCNGLRQKQICDKIDPPIKRATLQCHCERAREFYSAKTILEAACIFTLRYISSGQWEPLQLRWQHLFPNSSLRQEPVDHLLRMS